MFFLLGTNHREGYHDPYSCISPTSAAAAAATANSKILPFWE
jgi:hypothetical protein